MQFTFLVLMQEEGEKTVPLEVQHHVKHNKRGILSMGRLDDPNSGGSSFSILLGPAPHLDMLYTIFGYCRQSLSYTQTLHGACLQLHSTLYDCIKFQWDDMQGGHQRLSNLNQPRGDRNYQGGHICNAKGAHYNFVYIYLLHN